MSFLRQHSYLKYVLDCLCSLLTDHCYPTWTLKSFWMSEIAPSTPLRNCSSMCYFEGCKREFFSIGKAKELHVMAYRSDIGNALLLCSYLYSAEYVNVNIIITLFSESLSLFSFTLIYFLLTFTVLSSVILRFIWFLYCFFACECGNLGLNLPKSARLIESSS